MAMAASGMVTVETQHASPTGYIFAHIYLALSLSCNEMHTSSRRELNSLAPFAEKESQSDVNLMWACSRATTVRKICDVQYVCNY